MRSSPVIYSQSRATFAESERRVARYFPHVTPKIPRETWKKNRKEKIQRERERERRNSNHKDDVARRHRRNFPLIAVAITSRLLLIAKGADVCQRRNEV